MYMYEACMQIPLEFKMEGRWLMTSLRANYNKTMAGRNSTTTHLKPKVELYIKYDANISVQTPIDSEQQHSG